MGSTFDLEAKCSVRETRRIEGHQRPPNDARTGFRSPPTGNPHHVLAAELTQTSFKSRPCEYHAWAIFRNYFLPTRTDFHFSSRSRSPIEPARRGPGPQQGSRQQNSHATQWAVAFRPSPRIQRKQRIFGLTNSAFCDEALQPDRLCPCPATPVTTARERVPARRWRESR